MAPPRSRRRRSCALSSLLMYAAALTAARGECPAAAHVAREPASWPSLPPRAGLRQAVPPPPPACDAATGDCAPPWKLQSFDATFWPRGRLARAAVAAHSPDAWRPLLARLQAGLPITVVAFGSSVVEGHSGCFVSSRAALRAAGVATLPPVLARALNASDGCGTAGYVSAFMAAVNATWPHAEHVYVNAGQSAASLTAYAEGKCVAAWLPRRADLLLFEQHGAAVPGGGDAAVRDAEALYWSAAGALARRGGGGGGGGGVAPPPLVLLSLFQLPQRRLVPPPGDADAAIAACTGRFGAACADCGTAAAAALVARATAASDDGNATSPLAPEDALAAAARHHGWAALSLRDALAAGLRDGAHAALGWSECQWVNAFLKDWVHPSLPGRRLLADALITLLLAAQDAADGDASSACGYRDAESAAWQGVALAVAPLALRAWPDTLRGCTAAAQLSVASAAGFAAAARGGGWEARSAGALLRFNVSASFAALLRRDDDVVADPAPRVQLALQLTAGAGAVAAAACEGGCDCEDATLRGAGEFLPGGAGPEALTLHATAADSCALALRLTRAGDAAPGDAAPLTLHRVDVTAAAPSPLLA